MNIFQKMGKITEELATVAKNLNVDTGRGSYKAVSERDIIDAVKPLEAKYGVYSYPFLRQTTDSEILETESTYNGKATKKTTYYTRLETTYRFVNMDKPDEFIDIISYGVGLDSGDKGDGKAMTYADKYALMKAYKISTGDDPDQSASVDAKYTKVKATGYASDKDRKTIMDLCSVMNLDFKNILTQTGWETGKKLTQDQADKALIILQEISESRNAGN